MLIGDKRKFLSILLTLKTDVDPDSMLPLDTLTPDAREWCQAQGSKATTVSEILDTKDEPVLRGIQEGIDRSNARSTSRAQKVQKWSILPKDFSIPGDELGECLIYKNCSILNRGCLRRTHSEAEAPCCSQHVQEHNRSVLHGVNPEAFV
jgi:long-chain-fatty-acid--CoA ligase ACSBG